MRKATSTAQEFQAADVVSAESETMIVPAPSSADAVGLFINSEGLAALVQAVKEKVAESSPDVTTAKGRAEIKSLAHKITRTKTAVDEAGKNLVAKYKEIPVKIDANRKRLRDELDAIRDEYRRPLTEWEQAESDRIEALKARVDAFRTAANVTLETSDAARKWIDHVQGMEIDDSFAEMKGPAAVAKGEALTRLWERLSGLLNAEEMEKERQEKARQEMAAKAEAEAAEKVAREKLELENQALRATAAKEKAERDAEAAKASAEQKAAAAVADEKRRAAEFEAAERKRIEDRANNFRHRARIHAEIIDDLAVELDLDGVAAALFLDALTDGRIRNIKINY